MQRVEIDASIEYETNGYPADGVKVRILHRNDETLASIYQGPTGPAEWPNPLITDHGQLNGWLERGSYKFEIYGDNVRPRTEYFEAVPADEVLWIDAAGGGFDANYVHNQLVSSAEWVVTHNLGKYPSVTIVDSGDNIIVGEVHYDGLNQVTITLAAATSGKAYFN